MHADEAINGCGDVTHQEIESLNPDVNEATHCCGEASQVEVHRR